MNTRGTSTFNNASDGALMNVILSGASVPECKCSNLGKTRPFSTISPDSSNADLTSRSNSLDKKNDLPILSTIFLIRFAWTETSRLFPPCCPFSCSNKSPGTLPAFLSLAEMLFPEAARGIARIVSAAAGFGNPSRYVNGVPQSADDGGTMKVKKQKRHRRAVRFFTACFGFHQPYKVFCDGTFVHHLIANRIVPADIALSNILGGPVKLFTSRCVVEELKRLGPSYSQDIEAAHKLMTARCDHEGIKSAEACLTDIVGENNPEHFFIATQDADLRNKFQEVPGVPLIFGLRNSLFLEKPSSFQHEFVIASEVHRSILSERERDILKKQTSNILETAERGTSADEHERPGDDHFGSNCYVRNGINVKDRPQFKRKKAKGPNPLSCRKKNGAKTKASVAEKESKAANNSEAETSRRRTRKRPTTGNKKMMRW